MFTIMKPLIFGIRTLILKDHLNCMTRQCKKLYSGVTDQHNSSNDSNDLIAQEFGDKGLIILNKPKTLNTLSHSMGVKLLSTLQQWESSKNIVVIKGIGKDAFCAGADIKELSRTVAKSGYEKNEHLISYWMTYEGLLRSIEEYKKPFVALISGIVMGMGAGISLHGKFRVATETTVFGMPENFVGVHPDAGCTYSFPRLNGNLGVYLGLTGHLLKGIDVKLAGFATHYVPTSKLPELTDALLGPGDVNVEEILERFDEKNPEAEFSLAKHSKQIERCFGGDSVEEIIHRLKEDESKWAQEVIKTFNKMSPTSLKITLETFKRGKNMSFSECVDMESYVGWNMVVTKDCDFHEGVRAFFVDKDQKPSWNPKTLNEVTDEYVQSYFNKVELNQKSKF